MNSTCSIKENQQPLTLEEVLEKYEELSKRIYKLEQQFEQQTNITLDIDAANEFIKRKNILNVVIGGEENGNKQQTP